MSINKKKPKSKIVKIYKIKTKKIKKILFKTKLFNSKKPKK